MRAIVFSLLLSLTGLAPSVALAQSDVQGVRIWAAPDNTRIVFDLSSPVEHEIFELENPRRLVIDLKQARLNQDIVQPNTDDQYLQALRSGPRNDNDLRIVLDLKQSITSNSFLLKPNQRYGHRLVVDVHAPDAGKTAATTIAETIKATKPHGLRDVIIAIDAGHGGEDPGAIGPAGTYEKNVVMEISRRLADKVNAQSGMRAVLTRDGDYFLPLRRRIDIARQQQADLFVSIHADAFHDHRVSGSSVYVLSKRGASSEAARLLAERENAADLVGGVSLDDKDDVLRAVLLDLSQTGTLEASLDVAERVVQGLAQAGKVRRKQVQSAGFLVLKAPDIPSILIETAFISNPAEERKLRDPKHQDALTTALANGLRTYFREHAPEGTLLASQERARRHVIVRGETLSTIASEYQVSQDALMRTNGLSNANIRAGQVLTIPGGS